jgi:Bacterial mobilisation protein (MobC)
MGRHSKSDVGERRTAALRLQLTPSERAELETAAAEAGTHLSQYVRELCQRRLGDGIAIARTKRNPEARALMRELTAIGNNLNQMSRVANATKALPHLYELRLTTGFLKAALERVIEL